MVGWGGREPEDPMYKVKAILERKGLLNRKVGLEVPDYYMRPHEYVKFRDILGDSLVMEATRLIEEIKFVKSPAEIAYIRKASGINDAGMNILVESLAEGKTEFEVVAEVHRTLMSLGSDAPASPMNFASGERTAYAHGMPAEKRLEMGDLIHCEYGASYRRYHSTIGRVLCLGKPTERMKEVYQVVRDACDATIDAIKPGVPAYVPHEAAKKIISEAGMEEYRWHTSGYGIAPGFPPKWGESLQMDGSCEDILQAGMVVSIEPPVFIPEERLGARIIDNVLITESGTEILSKCSRDLITV